MDIRVHKHVKKKFNKNKYSCPRVNLLFNNKLCSVSYQNLYSVLYFLLNSDLLTQRSVTGPQLSMHVQMEDHGMGHVIWELLANNAMK